LPDLRVVDCGRVSALRSQTLWHALAYGVSAGAPPTLSFMRPSRPYVGVGYHRRLEEADLDACREAGLPVFRRMVGGGVVYLDEHQQFFQIILPLADVPRSREQALRQLLAPAVAAFRAVGVPAELDDDLEIVVGEAKVCGHGAAQIDDAVVVVGNLIERFDHAAAARVLAVPDEVRAEVVRLMERFVAATPVDAAAFRSAAADAYGEALGLQPTFGGLSPYERERLHALDDRFRSPAWLRGSPRPVPQSQDVKVRAGVYVVWIEQEGKRAVATVVRGQVERVEVSDPELDGALTAALAKARLVG
jgi:lipoate---protein ligase